MPETFSERALDAINLFRGDKSFTTLGRIESKSAPEMGRTSLPYDPYRYSSPWSRYYSQDIDYRHEVGDLDGHSLVMCVVNYTGTRLPEAKPTVLKKNKEGKFQPDPLHDLARLIRRPNRHSIWANYCLALSTSWWISGEAFFYRERDLTGKIIGLWYIPNFLIIPRWFGDGRAPEVPAQGDDGQPSDTYLSHYQYTPPGKPPILWPAKDVVHLKRGWDTLARSGVSGFKPLIKELYGDDKMAAFTAAIMKNMGIQVPVFSAKDAGTTLTLEQAAAMGEQWRLKTTGANAGSPVFMTVPVDMAKFGFSPTELDLSALRKIPESRVAAVLGIPAPTLGLLVGLENGTSYASSQQARQQGYEEVVIPMQQAIAEEITWQLLPEFEKEGTAEFSFDTSEVRVLQDDADNAMKRAATGYLAGVIKRSDARRIANSKLEVTADDEVFFDPRGGSIVKEGEDPLQTGTPAKGFRSVGDIESYLDIADVDKAISYLDGKAREFMVKE